MVFNMDLGENLSNSLEYAKKMARDAGRWVLLIVLGVIPIVNWIVMGYWARVVKETPASEEPPRLEGYGSMWVQGIKIIVAGIIYMIIPIALIVAGLATAIPWGMMRRPMAGLTAFPFLSGLALVMFTVAVVVSFLIAIIAVMGIVHMIKQDRFTKAFAVSEILATIGRIGWGSYILWLIVLFVISIIYSLIGGIPYIGWLVTLVLSPLFLVFTARSAALTYEAGRKPSAAEELAEAPSEGYKFCMECGARIPAEAEYCPKCGAKQ
ncbi:MAG: DUF4013 domain-containing protein [Candidatus Bathyarchaeia archaeon]